MKSSNSDVNAVKTLRSLPEFDETRDFTGIINLKMTKKDRHMKTLQEFSKFLEELNEKVVQNVLKSSRSILVMPSSILFVIFSIFFLTLLLRDVRESLEVIDKDLSIFYTDLDRSENLIVKSEDDLFDDLKLLREKLQHRGDIIMQFAQNLDDTENMRSDVASKELKTLVDKLIGIAHQLPDEIGKLLS